MASGSKSNETAGSQLTLEQEQTFIQSSTNEEDLEKYYYENVLPESSPIPIPPHAEIKSQQKKDYIQVRYKWRENDYVYICRWHTRTPNSPSEQGNSWVIIRHYLGIAAGSNARRSYYEVLIAKNKWILKETWDKATRAKNKGNATKEQKEILKNGHWDV